MLARNKVEDLVAEMLRRRQMGQLMRVPMSEALPSGETVDQAVMRAAPMVTPSDLPLTRPRRALSAIPEQPVVVNETPIPQMPLERPVFTPPIATEGLETRLRRVLPEDPLTVARENAQAARNLTLTDGGYGFDKSGNPRTGPKKGFWGRLAAGGKMFGRGVLPGMAAGGPAGGVGGGLAAMLAGIIDPSLPAQARKQEAVRRNEGTLERVLGEQKAITDLESDQTTNAYNRARTQRLLNPQWKIQKDAQGRILRVNPDTGETQVVHNVQKTEHPRVQWVDNKLMVVESDGTLSPAIDKRTGQEVTSRQKTPIAVEIDGQTIEMTPNAAGMAIATGQRTKVTQENQQARDAADWARREEDRFKAQQADYDNAVARRADLERQIGELKAQRDQARAIASDPNIPANDYRKYDAAKEAKRLDGEVGAREREYQGIKVQPPTPPRQAPQQQTYNPPRKVASADPWKEYVETYFNGDEQKAREYQNRRR